MTQVPRDRYQDRLDFAVGAARKAGASTLEHFGARVLDAETKGDGSPVTIADRNAEQMLRDMIGATYPHDAILGEEFDDKPGDSGFRWILDPIDGTRSFVHGVPLYGTLVACEHDRKSVVGVIFIPALNEIVYGALGCGAWHKQADRDIIPANVSSVDAIERACICTTSLGYFTRTSTQDAYHAIADRAAIMRGWSDCYAHVLLATGRIDAVIEPYIHAWDVAPLPPILGEIGGRYTNWRAEVSIHDSQGVATNGLLHDELLTLLAPTLANRPQPG